MTIKTRQNITVFFGVVAFSPVAVQVGIWLGLLLFAGALNFSAFITQQPGIPFAVVWKALDDFSFWSAI